MHELATLKPPPANIFRTGNRKVSSLNIGARNLLSVKDFRMRQSFLGRPRFIALLALLLVISTTIALTEPVRADSVSYQVSITTSGLPSFYYTRIFVDGVYNATIYGGQTWGPYYVSNATSHKIVVDDYVPDGYPYHSGYQWYSGYNWVAFYSSDNSWSFSGPGSHTFHYCTFFYLQIQSGRGQVYGQGWYPAGSWVRISARDVVGGETGTQYRFDNWSGAMFSADSHQPANSVLMDNPKLITANWVTQYKLTVNSAYGNPAGDNWYDSGSSATASVTTPVDGGTGTRYLFTGWTGDMTTQSPSIPITMDAPHTLTAGWKTQYFLTINANGGTVDRSSDWFDEDTSVTVSATAVSHEVQNQTRLSFAGWSGDVTSTALSVNVFIDSPKTLSASWDIQYYLRVVSSYGSTSGEGWYKAGSTTSFSVDPVKVPVQTWGYLGANHVFESWTGDASTTSQTSTLVMDGPKTVSVVWKDNYFWTYAAASVFTGMAVFGAAVWKRSAIVPQVKPFVRRLYRKKSGLGGETTIKPVSKPVPTLGLVRVCPRCRTELTDKAEYCAECGEKMA